MRDSRRAEVSLLSGELHTRNIAPLLAHPLPIELTHNRRNSCVLGTPKYDHRRYWRFFRAATSEQGIYPRLGVPYILLHKRTEIVALGVVKCISRDMHTLVGYYFIHYPNTLVRKEIL